MSKKKLTVFDKIVAEMLSDPAFRSEVKADASGAIGTHRWVNKLDDVQRAAINKIADESITTKQLDDALKGANSSSAFFFTDW